MEGSAAMEHVLKALDEHIAHQDWLLKSARREIEELRAQLDARKKRENGENGTEGTEGTDAGKGAF